MNQQSTVIEVAGLRRYWIDEQFEVGASVRDVYARLSDLRAWPTWAPGIASFVRRGNERLRVGDGFVFRPRIPFIPFPLAMPCEVYRMDERCIEWGLGLLGNEVRHRLELTPTSARTTRIRHAEYASNLMAIVAAPVAGIALRFNQALSAGIKRQFPPA
jgi:Polyketide cyclase / dehydrase and lipid transport